MSFTDGGGGRRSEQREGAGRDGKQSGRPREATIALILLVVLGGLLSFMGVITFWMAGEAADQFRSAAAANGMEFPFTENQITAILRVMSALILIVGLGNALGAHGLRRRKAWGRVVGIVFASIPAALFLLGAAMGLTDVTTLILLGISVGAVAFLAQKPVKDYLAPQRPPVA